MRLLILIVVVILVQGAHSAARGAGTIDCRQIKQLLWDFDSNGSAAAFAAMRASMQMKGIPDDKMWEISWAASADKGPKADPKIKAAASEYNQRAEAARIKLEALIGCTAADTVLKPAKIPNRQMTVNCKAIDAILKRYDSAHLRWATEAFYLAIHEAANNVEQAWEAIDKQLNNPVLWLAASERTKNAQIQTGNELLEHLGCKEKPSSAR